MIFDDGSTYICDVIICCTGYTSSFPMLDATLDIHHQDARNRFKKIINLSNQLSIENNSKFYFIYLPLYERFQLNNILNALINI